MHLPCIRKYFRAQAEPRCPQCNDFWTCDIPGTKNYLKQKKMSTIILKKGLIPRALPVLVTALAGLPVISDFSCMFHRENHTGATLSPENTRVMPGGHEQVVFILCVTGEPGTQHITLKPSEILSFQDHHGIFGIPLYSQGNWTLNRNTGVYKAF